MNGEFPLRVQLPTYRFTPQAWPSLPDSEVPAVYLAALRQAERKIMDWADEQLYSPRPINQGEPMPSIGNPNYSAGAIDAKPTQAGIEQNLDSALDRASLLLHRLETIHRAFIGPQPMSPNDGMCDTTPEGLIGRSQYLASRVERCLELADMIRACVDGS